MSTLIKHLFEKICGIIYISVFNVDIFFIHIQSNPPPELPHVYKSLPSLQRLTEEFVIFQLSPPPRWFLPRFHPGDVRSQQKDQRCIDNIYMCAFAHASKLLTAMNLQKHHGNAWGYRGNDAGLDVRYLHRISSLHLMRLQHEGESPNVMPQSSVSLYWPPTTDLSSLQPSREG